ncbi:hypothetical protein [Chromobacterium phragmitis]|uniref:Uncharacterized protein n=1 Tax=Chromobacterium phragmitis TaxID=2202141 RepID=A0ABV0IRP9_9NEIS
MNVNIGHAIAFRPQLGAASGAARVAGAAPEDGGKAEPLRDVNGRMVGTPESRYGMSMRTLQLLKQYDVRNMSGKDLDALAEVLAENGEMDGDVAMSIRGDIEGNSWKGSDERNALEIFAKRRDDTMASVKAGEASLRFANYSIKGYERTQQALEKLAAIHDALQSEDDVRAAANGSAAQARDLMHLERWMRSAEQADAKGEPLAVGKETAEAISRTMLRAGVELPPADNLQHGDWARQALQAYRGWTARHPNDKLDIDLKPAEEEDKKVFKEKPPAPAGEAQGTQLSLQPPSSAAKLAREMQDKLQTEARYGIGMPMLQLIKSTDISGLSIDQLKQYSQLLRDNGVLSQDDVESLLPLTQRAMADPMNYYKRDLNWLTSMQQQGRTPQYSTPGGMADLSDVAGRMRNDQQGQAVLERLQNLHQTLQGDDKVQTAAANGLQQSGDLAAFDNWARVESKGARNADSAELEFRGKQDVEGIFRVLQRLGVELTPLEGDSSPSQRLEQAWKDYQRWRDSHPGERPSIALPPKRGVDVYA